MSTKNKHKYIEIILSALSFLIMLLFSYTVLHNFIKLYKDKQYADMISCSDSLNAQIYDVIMKPFSKIISLSELAKTTNDPSKINPKQLDGIMNNIQYYKILFAHDNKISSVYPEEDAEKLIGKECDTVFQNIINNHQNSNISETHGPIICGPINIKATNTKVLATLIPTENNRKNENPEWGYVAILLEYNNLYNTIDFTITDERKVLCRIDILDKYTGNTTTLIETKKKIPEKVSKNTITCSKNYFTTPFITTLSPEKSVSKDKSFLFLSISLLLISFFVTVIIYFIIHSYITKQDYEYYEIQTKLLAVQKHTIISLSSLVENRDSDTGAHILRTSDYVEMITLEAKKTGLYPEITDSYVDFIKNAAPMHDIGKIIVPDSVLKKPGKLTDEEFEQIKLHASEGGRIIQDILGPVQSPDFLQISKDIAQYHHEKWNGKGYPFGKKGTEIPLCARIMALADVFDALTTPRCYKEPFSFEQAIEIIRKDTGTHFDPQLAEIFLNNQDKLRKIMDSYKS